jgi:hypothetical protein
VKAHRPEQKKIPPASLARRERDLFKNLLALLMAQIIAVFGSRFKSAHHHPDCSSSSSIDPASFRHVNVAAFTSFGADIH